MATHSSTLAWRIPWTEEPVRVHRVAKSRTRPNNFPFHLAFVMRSLFINNQHLFTVKRPRETVAFLLSLNDGTIGAYMFKVCMYKMLDRNLGSHVTFTSSLVVPFIHQIKRIFWMSSGQFADITIFYMGIKHVTFSWHSESSRKAPVSRQKKKKKKFC